MLYYCVSLGTPLPRTPDEDEDDYEENGTTTVSSNNISTNNNNNSNNNTQQQQAWPSIDTIESLVRKVVEEHNGSFEQDAIQQLQQLLQSLNSTNNSNGNNNTHTTSSDTNTTNDTNSHTTQNGEAKDSSITPPTTATENNISNGSSTPADGSASKQIDELQKKISSMEQQYQANEKSLKEQITMWKDKNKLKHSNYIQLEEQKNKAIWEQKEKFEAQIQKLVTLLIVFKEDVVLFQF